MTTTRCAELENEKQKNGKFLFRWLKELLYECLERMVTQKHSWMCGIISVHIATEGFHKRVTLIDM